MEQFSDLITTACHYCGRPPSQIAKEQSNKSELEQIVYNGIDRKDNDYGYIDSNCLPCCGICNKAKGDMTYEEFLIYLDDLIQFRTKYDHLK